VYYTPSYIVDYIVKETVGKLVEGKKPGPRGGVSKLKILDPACGSGSFLLGAYQYLLDWHLEQYIKDKPVKWSKGNNPRIYQKSAEDWRLTTDERKRILLNNIYGVDKDDQAVEVTKLSLLLKVLEGEDKETVRRQYVLFRQRALPDLGNNIKCGNSLIDPEIYDQKKLNFLDDEKIYQINAFDWWKKFPEIMSNGGFDGVIGNPPWGASFTNDESKYLKSKNNEIIVRMIDSYIYFVYRSAKLLTNTGLLGMIIPSTFLTQKDVNLLRKYILRNYSIQILINLGPGIFGSKVLNTSTILIFSLSQKNQPNIIVGDLRHITLPEKPEKLKLIQPIDYKTWCDSVNENPQTVFFTSNLPNISMLHKYIKNHPTLKDILYGTIQRGISPDYAEAFIIEKNYAKTYEIEQEILRPVVLGKHISRYFPLNTSCYIIYLTKNEEIDKYPNAKNHLYRFKNKITCKEVLEGKHPWYSLHRPRNPDIFSSPKFIGLTTTKRLCINIDLNDNLYATDATYLFKINPELKLNYKCILGILNSKAFQFFYWVLVQGEQRVIPQIKASNLYNLPFPIIDIAHPSIKERHDIIVSLVDKLFNLNLKLHTTTIPQDRNVISQQIFLSETKINKIVYELYAMSSSDIEIVENFTFYK